MFIRRAIEPILIKNMQQYPIVTVIGPRQSGKTTLVRQLFPDKAYFNFEDPSIQAQVQADPKQFISSIPNGAILDEIQRLPEILSYLQVEVDASQVNGQYILTGSHNFSLHQAVSQSLAGRTAILTLLPLTLGELTQHRMTLKADEQLLTGFYPRVYQHNLTPNEAYRSYFQTYIERDIRQIINLKNLHAFQQFMRMCAAQVGQVFNMNNIANDLGIANPTIKAWLSILEASFILYRLEPYYENFGKRLIKSPKYYFTDTGLACFLLGIETSEQLQIDRLRGALFENMVVMDMVKQRLNQGKDPQIFFFRDYTGHEIDIIFQQGSTLTPIEIKSSMTFQKAFLKGLNYFRHLITDRCGQGYLIYQGEQQGMIDNNQLLNYRNFIVDQL